jgi:pyridoxal phosphate enzyme (YggS family)
MTDSIKHRIQTYLDAMQKAAQTYHRNPDEIHLLAVSKNQSPVNIQAAFEAGIHDFGESYWQEAKTKQEALQHLPITWHFIGPIQSNKAKYITKHFNWVHSVSRNSIASLLNQNRPALLPKLNICLQVNIDAEPNKSGCMLDELHDLTAQVLTYKNLNLKGLMTIPQKKQSEQAVYQSFLKLKQAKDTLNQAFNLSLDTLSMGMTEDFIPAIHAGSTWIRIGRGIFNTSRLY